MKECMFLERLLVAAPSDLSRRCRKGLGISEPPMDGECRIEAATALSTTKELGTLSDFRILTKVITLSWVLVSTPDGSASRG